MNSIWHRLLKTPWLPAVLLFLICGMRSVELPGLYMDAVNPDYLAARLLHPASHNPVYELPSYFFNILGNYYHGVQNYYVAVPFLFFFGFSVTSIRLAQMLFGAMIVGASATIVQRACRSRALGLACGVGMATDIALLASFRDQNYIVLGGFAWTTLALLALLPRRDARGAASVVGHRRLFVCGLFSGLAAYGYFVQLFFFPALLLLALKQGADRRRTVVYWCLGVAVGMLPYVIGYLSMYLALGGLHPMLESLKAGVTTLQPIRHDGSLAKGLADMFQSALLAVSDRENEQMVLGVSLASHWGLVKFYLLCLCLVALVLALLAGLVRDRKSPMDLMIVLLPISFLGVGTIFGGRLGAHHFSVFVPIFYLMIAILLGKAVERLRVRGHAAFSRGLIVALTLVLMGANFRQQHAYLKELDRTGGVGRSSSALTTLAEQALTDGRQSIYAFPEWGFFPSFALLTGNRIPYILDVGAASIANARSANADRHTIRLLFWDEKDRQRYIDALKAVDAAAVEETDFRQRDGKIAFHMLSAALGPEQGTEPGKTQ